MSAGNLFFFKTLQWPTEVKSTDGVCVNPGFFQLSVAFVREEFNLFSHSAYGCFLAKAAKDGPSLCQTW